MNNIITETIKRVARIAPPKVIRLSMPDTDHVNAMLWITYDAMTETKPTGLALADTTIYSRPADTYHVIDEQHTAQAWQDMMSATGWELGAGYLYRWYHSPREMNHLFGMTRYDLGDGDVSATGDTDDVLAELAKQFGAWEWEINSAWGRNDRLAKWRKEDPRRDESGLRAGTFPGWASDHPMQRSDRMDYESHYYYVLPPKYNRRTDILVRS